MPSLLDWLDSPPLPNAADELACLHRQLATLRTSQVSLQQRASILERLYERSMSTVTALLGSLADAVLLIPIPRKTRQLIRSLQVLLQALAEDFLTTLSLKDDHSAAGLRQEAGLALWRSLHTLAQHLLISNLAASPAAVGIWRQLHQTYEIARHLELAGDTPEGVASTLQNVYYSAILLDCAQPASFTSREVNFVAAYLALFSDGVSPADKAAGQAPEVFWIDPTQDAAAFACSRKTAPPDTPVHYFSCARLAARLKEQLAELDAGASAEQIKLPDFAETPAGRGVLQRLVTYWGDPGKRRYPRRRQNYRATLCSGLDSLWRLFQDGKAATIETSSWMITNESPDGYAFMHVSGKIGGISVGDITAIRTDSGKNWQICIVRWALSENQEHLELGLQILATRAVSARLALPSHNSEHTHLSVLILPAIRELRSTEMLVVPSGSLEDQPTRLVLIVEKENIKVREVTRTRLDEQNSQIAVFSIEPVRLASTPPELG
ncbi:hypothetical protein [Propionivibrio sp.]|uniref:hypothetical protein n=1 Tax=Propionivibrio sp. TaxID=2212460 RepID=UPI00260CCA26|nr:hypothetical protein [Propionivibrio sp.]